MRISATRIEITLLAVALFALIALAVAPAWWGRAFGHELCKSTQPNTAGGPKTVDDGQKTRIEGIVIKRDDDGFTVRGTDGAETVVILTNQTEIKTAHKSLFRSDRTSSVTQIVRGLRLTVEGRGNPEGQLVARIIRFDEGIVSQSDLKERTAVVQLTNLP